MSVIKKMNYAKVENYKVFINVLYFFLEKDFI